MWAPRRRPAAGPRRSAPPLGTPGARRHRQMIPVEPRAANPGRAPRIHQPGRAGRPRCRSMRVRRGARRPPLQTSRRYGAHVFGPRHRPPRRTMIVRRGGQWCPQPLDVRRRGRQRAGSAGRRSHTLPAVARPPAVVPLPCLRPAPRRAAAKRRCGRSPAASLPPAANTPTTAVAATAAAPAGTSRAVPSPNDALLRSPGPSTLEQ